jgi:CheY-like chemotaxis protein
MAGRGSAGPSRVAPAAIKARQPKLTSSILVVDDDPIVLAVVSRVLRRAGALVTEATNGRDALRAVAGGETRPTILLTDVDMPEMNGIELAARIRSMRPKVAVVLMTGDPASAAAARAHPDQVGAVLLKPITTDELLLAVRRAALGSVPGAEGSLGAGEGEAP